MQHRDIIKDQIDQLGKVLAALLAKVMAGGNPMQGISLEECRTQLKTKTDFDIECFATLSGTDVESFFAEDQWDAFNLYLLSKLLYRLSLKDVDPKRREALNTNAITIHTIANSRSDLFSLERQSDLHQMQQMLSNLDRGQHRSDA